jgi:hypothetical protein
MVALAILVGGALALACSSKPPAAATCDPKQCAPGNDCIDDGSGPSCHKVCTQQDCPFGYYCNDGRPKSWCVGNTLVFPQGTAQWGTPCMPPKERGNPACDNADAFGCYGISPTDANAFCTQFDCLGDSDCAGGWWCETVNVSPNVTTTASSFGTKPRQVCVPRWYCAPCQLDHDCSPLPDGRPQYCMNDSKGNMYCTPRCTATANCASDAKCAPHWNLCLGGTSPQPCTRDEDCPPSAQNVAQHCDLGPVTGGMLGMTGVCAPECGSDADCDTAKGQHCQTSNNSYCTPRAGVCKGDGSLCSPCRSDADCTHGYCVEAPYSGERFCSQMANGMCPGAGACPTKTGVTGSSVACTTMASDFAPVNQCVGVVSLGGTDVPGCWTVPH